MLARVRRIATTLMVFALAGAVATAGAACSDRTVVGGAGVDERWTTTENTKVAIDWDKVAEAYRLADGPADFERRVNEIYEGEEVISIAVRDDGDRTQVITGFFDKNGDGRVSDPALDAVLTAPAPVVAPAAPAVAPAAPVAAATTPAVAEAPAAAAAPPPTAAPAAASVTAGAPVATTPAPAAASAPSSAPSSAVAPVVPTAAAPAIAAAPPAPAAASLPEATGTESEAIFTIRRTVGADGSAQVQTVGYGMYSGYHSPVMSIMTGMLMGSMMSAMFMPTYVPVGMYATSASRAGELRSQRAGYRAANPSRFSKPSKTGRAYGGTSSGGKSPSSAPSRSRGGSRFGVARAVSRVAHLVG